MFLEQGIGMIENYALGQTPQDMRKKINEIIDALNGIIGDGGEITVSWDDVEDKPEFAEVATSGSYNDLGDTPTLGTAASSDTGDFATAAQGELADTAVQPGDLSAVATSGSYADLSNTPTVAAESTADAADTGDWTADGAGVVALVNALKAKVNEIAGAL